MTERLAAAGSGFPIAYAGERALHSRYDPRAEAEKYIDTLKPGEAVRFFILIEPGLGYIIPPLKKKFPRAKIIVLHVSDFFTGRDSAGEDVPVWTPETGISLPRFLEKELPDTFAGTVKIVEWRPALAAYGKPYLRILEKTVEFIKRIDANARTVHGFGRRWFKNFFKNIGIIQTGLLYDRESAGAAPVLITGAGPGLDGALPLIRRRRGELFILGVSSSVKPLLAGGVRPDLVISADGGNWALFHLYEVFRGSLAGQRPVLATALTAALPAQCKDLPILPLSDGSVWQNLILERLGIPFLSLPQRGTVTATALDIALSLTSGPVYLAGVDLSQRDIRTHARSYSFDRFWRESASRLNPAYSQAYARSRTAAASGAYDIYAAWFKEQLGRYPERIYSLGSNNPVFAPLREEFPADGIPGKNGMAPAGKAGISPIVRSLPPGDRPREALKILSAALGGAASAARGLSPVLREELSPLLLPERQNPAFEEITAVMYDLAGRYTSGQRYG
jgi:hypothetical protein